MEGEGRCGLVGLFVNNKLASAPRVEGSNPLPDVFSFEMSRLKNVSSRVGLEKKMKSKSRNKRTTGV